jgi:glycosyltransferase involved in cell wall biosynthesis
VTFLGRQADVHRYFAAADLFVLPTLYEPFGMAVLEAMASGLPVVTSRTAGVAELITDREDGLLLDDPTDATAIATAVHLLVDSPELREHLGRTAREKVSGYSWDYVVRETLNVYRTVMDGRA